MKYSTNNITVSVAIDFATFLRSKSYDIFWWASGDTDSRTSGEARKDIITITPTIPANPAHIVRLKDGTLNQNEVGIPAFSVLVESTPKKIGRAGVGESVFLRQRSIVVQGLATDSYQHDELADLLSEWLDGTDKYFSIYDYDSYPESPPLIEKAWVQSALVLKPEIVREGLDVYRYQLNASATLRYFE